MEIEYREFTGGKKRTNSLSNIVEAKSCSYEYDDIVEAKIRAKNAIEFTEKVVELLYKKGLLNDKDITTLVSELCSIDEEDIKVVNK